MIYNWNSFVLNYYKSSLDLQYFGPVETNLIKKKAIESGQKLKKKEFPFFSEFQKFNKNKVIMIFN